MYNTVTQGMSIVDSEGNIPILSPSSFLETYPSHQLSNTDRTKMKAFVAAAPLAIVAARPDGGHHGHHAVHAPVVGAPLHHAVHAALPIAQAVHADHGHQQPPVMAPNILCLLPVTYTGHHAMLPLIAHQDLTTRNCAGSGDWLIFFNKK